MSKAKRGYTKPKVKMDHFGQKNEIDRHRDELSWMRIEMCRLGQRLRQANN